MLLILQIHQIKLASAAHIFVTGYSHDFEKVLKTSAKLSNMSEKSNKFFHT